MLSEHCTLVFIRPVMLEASGTWTSQCGHHGDEEAWARAGRY